MVIPAYNEASRIERTLAELTRVLPSLVAEWEIRVVDDGSCDATAAIVENLAREDERVVVQREPHRGKGGTVRAGMLAARGDLIFMCDADMSMPASELSRFLPLVPSRFDVVVGSREGAGAKRVGEPDHRHLMGRLFNTLVRKATIADLNDTQCGFKLFSRRAVDDVFPRVTIAGWAFDIEALVIARRRGLRIHELPIEWHYREDSQLSALRDSMRMARDVLRIRANSARGVYDQ